MLKPGDTVCVGLSGGADSVCLLLVLLALRREGLLPSRVRLCAVHVNHCLRGEESDADQAFVEELCQEQQVPLYLYSFPVREIARQKGLGEEETGRLLRREAFADCVKKYGVTRIALAHHKNDCAETFLFHAARGSSLRGLGGIRPRIETDGLCLVRPLLCVKRTEIEQWLRARNAVWRTDRTNLEEDYTRNGLRLRVIPYLEQKVNAGAVDHIAELAEDLAETEDFLAEETGKRAGKYLRQGENSVSIRETVLFEPRLLQNRLYYLALCTFCGSARDIGRAQVRDLANLMEGPAGKYRSFPYGVQAVREYDGVVLFRQVSRPDFPAGEFVLSCPGEQDIGNWHITCRLYGREKAAEVLDKYRKKQETAAAARGKEQETKHPEDRRKKYTECLNYDKIKYHLVLRTRKPGDYLAVSAEGGRKKLKDYLIDSKVPQRERDSLVLLASGSEIWWIIGYRISESCKVTQGTEHVLEITAEQILPVEEREGAEHDR